MQPATMSFALVFRRGAALVSRAGVAPCTKVSGVAARSLVTYTPAVGGIKVNVPGEEVPSVQDVR